MTKRLYQVGEGETLPTVAHKVMGDRGRWPELAHLNAIAHPYFVRVGQVIELPSPDDEPAVIVKVPNAPAATRALLPLSPATWGLIAAGVLFFFWVRK